MGERYVSVEKEQELSDRQREQLRDLTREELEFRLDHSKRVSEVLGTDPPSWRVPAI